MYAARDANGDRYCGHVFCELCTSHRSLIRADQILSNPERQYLSVNGHNPQRVCDPCYNVLLPVQAELRMYTCAATGCSAFVY